MGRRPTGGQDSDGGKARAVLTAELRLAGLTQAQFCRLLGVTTQTVNRWLRLRQDGVPVPRYAKAFLKLWHMASQDARSIMLNDTRL